MRRRLQAWKCTNHHTTLQPDSACPSCGAVLREFLIPPDAVLELMTTVHVNPTGEPYRLGIAVTRAGRARTICRVEGPVRGSGHDRVVLERRGDMIVALGRR